MKRGRAKRYLSSEEYREFWAAVTRNGSAPCFYAWLSNRPCHGGLDADHVLPQRVLAGQYRSGACIVDGGTYLAVVPEPRPGRWVPVEQLHGLTWDGAENHDVRTRSLKELLMDPRNGVPACRQHHDDKEAGVIWAGWERLPVAAREFATELGMEWWYAKRSQRRVRHAS